MIAPRERPDLALVFLVGFLVLAILCGAVMSIITRFTP